MLKHLKLTTIGNLFFSFIIIVLIVIICSNFILNSKISFINTKWELFQSEQAEKAHLENSLHTAIGYGGLIHEFKNYILYQNPASIYKIYSSIGAVHSVLHQYKHLKLSTAENAAIEDIKALLGRYDIVLKQVTQLIKQNKTPSEIDTVVQQVIDDTIAINSLKILHEQIPQLGDFESKVHIIADLRAAIGYAGIIRYFKNYIIYYDTDSIREIEIKLKKSLKLTQEIIIKYSKHNLDPNSAEEIALKYIESITQKISEIIVDKKEPQKIDEVIQINDKDLVLRGLEMLDKEIATQLTTHNKNLSLAIKNGIQFLEISTFIMIIVILIVAIFSFWLMKWHIIAPILRIVSKMLIIIDNQDQEFTIKLEDRVRDNELGKMARSLEIFNDNITKRINAETKLAETNKEMDAYLHHIDKLHEGSEKQTEQVLELAEELSAANKYAEEESHRANSILSAVHDAIITVNTHGIIENVNPSTEEMFGYRAKELIGRNVSIFMPEPVRSQHNNYIHNFVNGESQREIFTPIEEIAVSKDGRNFAVEITINTMKIIGEMKIIGVIKDITERKRWEKEIKRLAMTDPLTGLANRNQYSLQLEEATLLFKRNKQAFALLLIDLDKFKPVNDTYGHQVGDIILQHIAKVLKQCCRKIDTVSRLGGDEFAIILMPTENSLDATVPAQRIINQLLKPVITKEHTITIGASIGISYSNYSDDVEELQRQADIALYQAKESGRNTYCTFQK